MTWRNNALLLWWARRRRWYRCAECRRAYRAARSPLCADCAFLRYSFVQYREQNLVLEIDRLGGGSLRPTLERSFRNLERLYQ